MRAGQLPVGVTLIELMIVLAVIAAVLALGAPAFFEWNQNSQIRSAAESMLAGIKLARGEALKRNTTVNFQMMTTTDSSCALSTSGPNWVVSQGDAASRCDASDPLNDFYIVRVKQNGDTANVVFSSNQAKVDFNGLGRLITTPGTDVTIDITNPTGGSCLAASGPMRCQRILVTAGGQARLCDPSISSTTDVRRC